MPNGAAPGAISGAVQLAPLGPVGMAAGAVIGGVTGALGARRATKARRAARAQRAAAWEQYMKEIRPWMGQYREAMGIMGKAMGAALFPGAREAADIFFKPVAKVGRELWERTIPGLRARFTRAGIPTPAAGAGRTAEMESVERQKMQEEALYAGILGERERFKRDITRGVLEETRPYYRSGITGQYGMATTPRGPRGTDWAALGGQILQAAPTLYGGYQDWMAGRGGTAQMRSTAPEAGAGLPGGGVPWQPPSPGGYVTESPMGRMAPSPTTATMPSPTGQFGGYGSFWQIPRYG